MGTPTILLATVLLFLPGFTNCQMYNFIAPNVFRVESEEKVVVESHDFGKNLRVDVVLQDFLDRKIIYTQAQVMLNAANNFLGVATVKLPADRIQQNPKVRQFVYLIARCAAFTLEKVILVSFESGYIFVQTDKPLYTPTDKVFYRLFAVGHQLTPSSANVTVDFVNPDDIIAKRQVFSVSDQSGIISSSFDIPRVVNTGIWKVVAIYTDAPQKNFSTEFEVKEYVLPSFEVKIDSDQSFFYVDDNSLTVTITCRYLYGKPVDGSAYVLFGVQMDDEKRSISESLKRVPIENGGGTATLTRDMLIGKFPNINELIGHSIYVAVTVLTNAGSDMVETEKTGIQIVTSPFKILFTKTPKYYKPGMPFELTAYVTNPDGTPANRIPVVANPGSIRGVTHEEGTVKLVINTPGIIQNLHITVKTESPALTQNQQASVTMTAQPYRTQGGSNNYLHISVTATVVTPGENINILFYLNNDPGVQENIKHFTYVIMSKGNIVKTGRQPRQPGQTLVIMSLSATTDFIPSFRVIGYYTVNTPKGRQIVSDSVWVDVKDTCIGTLQVKPAEARDKLIQEPGKTMWLKLIGDPGAKVGLFAIDKGVFVLNKKNKLTQAKIWDVIENNDIGCTPGGGANNVGVFSDAGLAFHSTVGISTDHRSAPDCPAQAKRKHQSAVLMQAKCERASKYQDNHQLRKSCEDGMYENLMGHSCERRAEYITDGRACVDAFIDCCKHIGQLRKKRNIESLITASGEEDDGFLLAKDIMTRTQFPDSWLWNIETLPAISDEKEKELSSKVLQIFLKDSITTWEVQAVSLSPKKGVCVAEPYEITVMKDFFIELRLPYSAVRNEQTEIKAIVYNYSPDEITVRVRLIYNPQVCSVATANTKYFKDYMIPKKSSVSVPYVIVPMQLGEVEIEVKGSVMGKFVSDGVKKKLRVITEGMKVVKNIKSVILDPVSKGIDGKQEELVKAIDMRSVVPNTEPEIIISVKGNIVAETIENSIDVANLKHLIQVPSGSGEANMISLTPSVISTHYLDKTKQWDRIGPDHRKEAIKYILQGYTQQLAYRKPSGAYADFTTRPPSTWLTAYTIKVFSMAYHLITIDTQILCGAVKWLILEKQNQNGIFKEDAPVLLGEMIGGFRGAEPDATLTAFVLIAMSEAREICHKLVGSLDDSIKKATTYLKLQYEALKRTYSIAIVSYALSLQNELKTELTLMKASTGMNHWRDLDSDQYTYEATAYALLALVKLGKYNLADAVVRWITDERFYGGGYGSTQSTMMVLQAIAQYSTDIAQMKDFELDVTINLPGRARPIIFRINKDNALPVRYARTKVIQDFTVVASGTGQGNLTVWSIYHEVVKEEERKCKNFDLNVTVEVDDSAERPMGAQSTVFVTICTRFLGKTASTMTILDVSMLTGFQADLKYLNRLKDGVDKYISNYEINKVLSDKGSLIIYVDKISNKRDECLKIKADQFFKVGLLQPAAVTVYEYYNRDNLCTKFYHPSKESGLLSKICVGVICRCAEENCVQTKYNVSKTAKQHKTEACAPGRDFVYKVKLLDVNISTSYDYYGMEILEIIKAGAEEVQKGLKKTFIAHSNCRQILSLQVNKQYLIKGHISDLWNLKEGMSYIIGENAVIEWWPTDVECQDNKYQKMCTDFQEFADNMSLFDCSS